MGLLMRGAEAVSAGRVGLLKALDDKAPAVRVAAGEALGRFGSEADSLRASEVLVECADAEKNGVFLSLMALNALDYVGVRARPLRSRIESLPDRDPLATKRIPVEVNQLKTSVLSQLR
jgi:HEAT repeat protein